MIRKYKVTKHRNFLSLYISDLKEWEWQISSNSSASMLEKIIKIIKIACLRSKYGCQSHLIHLKSWVSFHGQLRQKPFLTQNPLQVSQPRYTSSRSSSPLSSPGRRSLFGSPSSSTSGSQTGTDRPQSLVHSGQTRDAQICNVWPEIKKSVQIYIHLKNFTRGNLFVSKY